MRRFLVCLAIGFLGCLPACSGGDSEAAREARFQREVRAASKQAREQLPFFWERFAAPAEDQYDFLVRAEFADDDAPDAPELLWVEVSGRDDVAVSGFIASDPAGLAGFKRGDPVSFDEDEIVDWAFFQGEQLLGHYTTRVALPRMDVDQAEALRSILGDNPQ